MKVSASSGFGMIETLVAVGMLGTFVAIASSSSSTKIKLYKEIKAKQERLVLVDNLSSFLTSASGLLTVPNLESNLKSCLKGTGCDARNNQSLTLNSPWGRQIAPQTLGMFGAGCNSFQKCTQTLEVFYTTACPGSAGNCPRPSYIGINWKITDNDSNLIVDQSSDAMQITSFECPDGSALVSISETGDISCIDYASRMPPVGYQGQKGRPYDWNGDPFSPDKVSLASIKNCGKDYSTEEIRCPVGQKVAHTLLYNNAKWYWENYLAKPTYILCLESGNGTFIRQYVKKVWKDGKEIEEVVKEYSHDLYAFDFTKPGCPQVAPNYGFRQGDGTCPNALGCFREGTNIMMADGTLNKIELVQPGDMVWNPVTQRATQVFYKTVGPEYEPLIEVKTDSQTLYVTQKHPMLIGDSQIIQAKHLLPLMDVFVEKHKKEKILSVRQVSSLDLPVVYNIKLLGDSDADHFVLSEGIITGDLYLQEKLDKLP